MAEIIRESKHEWVKLYELNFWQVSDPSNGFGFDCDENGTVDVSKLPEASRNNYHFCENSPALFTREVTAYESHVFTPALLLCGCGRHLELSDSWVNTCSKCGAEYNGAGQRLAPRRFWGEETGERF